MRIGLANNPDLIAVTREARAAGYDVRVAEAGRLPTLSGVLSGTYINEIGGSADGFPRTGNQLTIGLNARVPIFQGGLPAARIAAGPGLRGPGPRAGGRHRARGRLDDPRRFRRL